MHTCAYSSLPPPCEEGFRGGSCLCSQVVKIVVGEVEEMCEQKKKKTKLNRYSDKVQKE